jgi:hypothetical protein
VVTGRYVYSFDFVLRHNYQGQSCTLFPYRSEDNLQQRVDKIDDDQGLLPLSMGVPLVGQLQVNLPEAVGQ